MTDKILSEKNAFWKESEGKYAVTGEDSEYDKASARFERLYLGRGEICEDVWQE